MSTGLPGARAGAFTRGAESVWEGVVVAGCSSAHPQMGQRMGHEEGHYVEALPSCRNRRGSQTSSEISGFSLCLPGSLEWGESEKVSPSCCGGSGEMEGQMLQDRCLLLLGGSGRYNFGSKGLVASNF